VATAPIWSSGGSDPAGGCVHQDGTVFTNFEFLKEQLQGRKLSAWRRLKRSLAQSISY
jgi:hypothetical protein